MERSDVQDELARRVYAESQTYHRVVLSILTTKREYDRPRDHLVRACLERVAEAHIALIDAVYSDTGTNERPDLWARAVAGEG